MFATLPGREKADNRHARAQQPEKTLTSGRGGISAFASASIIVKTMVLLAVFIVAVGSVNLYIRAQISHSSEAVDAQSAALNDLQTVRTAAKAFNDLRYWYADLANSLSEESEKAADAAGARMTAALTLLESRFAADVATIRDHVARLGESSLAALDEYVMDNRDQGNAHMAEGRAQIADVDRIIAALVETLTREAGEKGQAVQAAAADALRFSMFGIAIPVVFAVIVGFMLIMLVARPVRSMTEVTRRLASGDLDRDVPAVRTRDEIGQMADALRILRDNLRQAEQMRLAQDEAQERVQEERRAAMLSVADEMERAVSVCANEISEAATRLQHNAKQMSEVARGTDRQSSSAVGSAEEAAQHIASVASATNELSASISEVVREIERSAGMARNAVKLSEETSGVVDRLSAASDRIDSVVQLINDIAEQTNLLALNATIEAARAGEAGRGFAIVASEVKSLAIQTTGATTDISGQIQEIKSIAEGSVSAMGQVQQVILDIENRISSLAAAAEQQNVTTQGISRNIGDVAHNARTISTVVQDIAEAAKVTGVASEGTHGAAAQLAGQTEILKNSVQELIGRLRANG